MKDNFPVYTFSIAAIIAALSLFVLILGLGFQSQSLADVFTINGTFSYFESGYDIAFTFLFPLMLVLGFSILVFIIINSTGNNQHK